jgi:peroxiredoxin
LAGALLAKQIEEQYMRVLRVSVAFVASLVLAGFVGSAVRAQDDAKTANMFVTADDDGFDPGLPIGAAFPDIEALYRGEPITSLDGLVGVRGTVLIANRSVDWCPYCRRQIAELQEHADAFESAGLAVVILTYDTPELQQAFIDAGSITFPFISDVDTASMRALGILNEQYAPGDPAYGIPYPGVFVIDPEQNIAGKIFIESYRERIDGRSLLGYALEVLEAS